MLSLQNNSRGNSGRRPETGSSSMYSHGKIEYNGARTDNKKKLMYQDQDKSNFPFFIIHDRFWNNKRFRKQEKK